MVNRFGRGSAVVAGMANEPHSIQRWGALKHCLRHLQRIGDADVWEKALDDELSDLPPTAQRPHLLRDHVPHLVVVGPSVQLGEDGLSSGSPMSSAVGR